MLGTEVKWVLVKTNKSGVLRLWLKIPYSCYYISFCLLLQLAFPVNLWLLRALVSQDPTSQCEKTCRVVSWCLKAAALLSRALPVLLGYLS